MKKIYFLFALPLLLLASCIDDESTTADHNLFINIRGINSSYDVVSYSGDRLQIQPVVTTSTNENDMEYTWVYYDNSKLQALTNKEYLAEKLDSVKDLDYLVGLPDGQFTFVFTARQRSTGYSQSVSTTVRTASSLSRGFFILKETSDGNTDIDMLNATNGNVSRDLLTNYQGQPLNGTPRHIDVVWEQNYIDPTYDEPRHSNCICVTTNNDEVRWIRVLDCTTVMDASNCHFETMQGEKPYRCVEGLGNVVLYFTSNGIYNTSANQGSGTGIFGAFDGTGASTHVLWGPTKSNLNVIFWNDNTHGLGYCNYRGQVLTVTSDVEGYPADNTEFDCLTCGHTVADGDILFYLLQDRNNPQRKVLYFVDMTYGATVVNKVVELDPASHMANATCWATSRNQATIAYCVDNNKLYAYDLTGTLDDKELKLEGIGADEQITYISNRHWNGDNEFDYLLVGTQSGDTYHLYMYNTIGGEPSGKPAQTVTGTGRIHSVDYVDPGIRINYLYLYIPIVDL